jgi:putative transcriptional regulator
MRSLSKTFGATVRELREKAGFSQEGFAHAAGVSRTYMSEIERGVTNVSLDTISRVAKGLGIRMSVLVTHVEKEL